VLELRRRQIGEGVDHRWLLRALVTRDEPAMVGRIGFHGPPDPNGMVEIGYKIDAQYRRRGYGFECAERLIAAAEQFPQVTVVRASIAPENVPSLRIAERLGLERVGEHIDEIDGLASWCSSGAPAADSVTLPSPCSRTSCRATRCSPKRRWL
jgi:ribosomal-protein-alanine N-acetyltransferase